MSRLARPGSRGCAAADLPSSAAERARYVTERINLHPTTDFPGRRCSGASRISAIGLRLKVQAGPIWKVMVPHDAAGVVDDDAVTAGGKHNVPG